MKTTRPTPLTIVLVAVGAAAAALVSGSSTAQAARSADQPITTWFVADAAPPTGGTMPLVSPNTIQSRTVAFNAADVVRSLVRQEDWSAAQRGTRAVVPAGVSEIAVQLFGGKVITVHVTEVALRIANDSELGFSRRPTVEVIGRIGDADSPAGSAGLVFMPELAGGYTLVGELQNEPTDRSTSIVPLDRTTYRLEVRKSSDHTLDGRDDAIAGPTQTAVPPAEAPASGAHATSTAAAGPQATQTEGSGGPVIDIAVAYKQGTYPNPILQVIENNVNDTNVALANSGLNTRVRLIFTQAIDAPQAEYFGTDFDALKNGTGSLAAFRDRLEGSGVDLIALQVPIQKTARKGETREICGLGNLPRQASGSWSKNEAFSVSAASSHCEDNWWTFAHEIGHNLGGHHNLEDIGTDNGPFPYARGHRVLNVGMDVMSYPGAVGLVYPRKLQFSNTAVNFLKTSTPSGTSGPTGHRNASSINELDSTIAGYRDLKPAWDVPPSHPFYFHIQWVIGAGLITVGSDLSYRHQEPVSRGAMAAIIYRRDGSPAYSPPAISPFPDVSTTHAFYKVITWASARGIMSGYSNGNFGPSDDVTRGQTASIIYKAAGSPAYTPPATSPFPDVPKSHTFYRAITWVVANGIANGYGDGSFGPDDDVTRGQMAVFLHKIDGM